jgi:phage tail sheath gpL-like
MRIAVLAQGATASTFPTDKEQVFDADYVGQKYGTGSPLHLIMRRLKPAEGGGVGNIPITLYPLDDAGTGVAATGDVTPSLGTIVQAAYKVRAGNIDSAPFLVEVGDAVADVVDKMVIACNSVPAFPLIAADGTTKLDLTAKWKGLTGNDIEVEIIGPTGQGADWAFTQPAGGLVNPEVDTALTLVGNVWETIVINGLGTDSDALDALAAFGEARWAPLVRKPLVSVFGNTEATVATAYAVTDARKTDRVNVQAVNPGSKDLPFVVATELAVRIANTANGNPARDYCAQALPGLVPGADSVQWDGAKREAAVVAGCSTVEVVDSVVRVSDTVTCYHPTGEAIPKYRYVCDLMKLWQVIYNLGLVFDAPEWAGAPLIPDFQPTANPTAKKPKMAKAAAAKIVDDLALEAILADPDVSKAAIIAAISSTNAKRLDLRVPVFLSGNTNIISTDLLFSFYYGGAVVVG